MNAMPLISICIANYNGIGVIDDCIRSVLEQTGGLSLEIIIHDDASTDDSVEHIRLNYPSVSLIESPNNVGFCISNNRMVAAAKGEYILLLNNDAALFPDALSTLYQASIALEQPAILGLPQFDFETGALIDIGSLLDPFLNPVPNLDRNRNDVGMVMGACLWIPHKLWDELDGFPEWFGSIGEDLYLCCRARLAGYPVKAMGNSGFRHRVGQSFGGGKVAAGGRLTTTKRRRGLSEKNKSFVMVLMYPTPLFHFIFPTHLVFLLMEGLLLALAKMDWSTFQLIYLASFKALWIERHRLQTLRHKIQAGRKATIAQIVAAHQLVPHKLRMLIRHGLPKLA
jgi:glycosyltransferase involved in cell wall biosynthesis